MVNPEIKARIKKEMPELLYQVCKNIGDHFKVTEDPMPDVTIVNGKHVLKKAVDCNGYSVTFTVETQMGGCENIFQG